jgi:hypothetical protein
MKEWRPIFVENSKIPIWLSNLAPININAITIFPFVFSRGKMNEVTKEHETIHFQQYLETGVIGFLILYFWDYFVLRRKGLSKKASYRLIRAEQEAYAMAWPADGKYLRKRKRWAWLKDYKL